MRGRRLGVHVGVNEGEEAVHVGVNKGEEDIHMGE